jgi:hypothetical protein
MKKFITTSVLITTCFFTFFETATAQKCPIVDSQEEAYARAIAVFIGKVNQIGNIFAMTRMGPVTACLVTYTVTFAVEKSYFRASDPEFTISSDYPLGDLKESETYLVYVYAQDGMASTIYDYRENGLATPPRCSRTRLISDAEGDIPFLEDRTNRSAGVTIHGSVTRKRQAIPLSGVKLEVKGNGRTYDAVTDTQGKYQVTGLGPAKYRVRVKLPWKLRSSRSTRFVTVSDRGSVNESFVVKPRFSW